jgi:hypothetical protein
MSVTPLSKLRVSPRVRDRLALLRKSHAPSQLWLAPDDQGLEHAALSWIAAFFCERAVAVEDTGPNLFGEVVSEEKVVSEAPCGQCDACRHVATAVHGDVNWVRPEKEHISIDQIRSFHHWTVLRSSTGHKRFGVIEQAHLMNHRAQNALLKMFEESPPALTIILLTHNLSALLPTIRSRAQIFRWSLLEGDDVAEWISDSSVRAFAARDGFRLSLMDADASNHLAERTEKLKEWVDLFLLDRLKCAEKIQANVQDSEWREEWLKQGQWLGRLLADLWVLSQNASGPLHFESLRPSYMMVVTSRPQIDWRQWLEQWEDMMRTAARCQDQLLWESFLYPLYLGEGVHA